MTPALGSLSGLNSAGADAFFGLGLLFDKAPDRNAPGYGPDLN